MHESVIRARNMLPLLGSKCMLIEISACLGVRPSAREPSEVMSCFLPRSRASTTPQQHQTSRPTLSHLLSYSSQPVQATKLQCEYSLQFFMIILVAHGKHTCANYAFVVALRCMRRTSTARPSVNMFQHR